MRTTLKLLLQVMPPLILWLPENAESKCLNTSTNVVIGSSTGQPSSGQSVVCDATSPNPSSSVISATANSSNVSVTVLPGSIISPGVRAIGVVNSSTVLNQGDIRTGANNSFGITSTGNGSTLTNSGTIETTGPNGYGLDARGSNTTLINNGTITTSGDNSAGVRTTETTAATLIQNSGTINVTGSSSAGNGSGIVFQTGAVGTFINLAGGAVTSMADAAVRGGDGSIIVRNAGTLTGGNGTAIQLGNGNNMIQITAGQVNGAIVSGSGTNQFSLSGGTINGSLSFGGGANTFNLTGGTINGGLTSGAGNDNLLLSTGASITGPVNGGGGVNGLTLAGSGTGAYSGAVSNFQNLTKQGSGYWTLTGPITGATSLVITGGTLVLPGSGSSTFSTTLSGGTVKAISPLSLGSGHVTFDGGILQAGGTFALANAASLNATGGTIDANGQMLTYSGVIANGTGSGNLVIANSSASPGTVSLSGTSTYTGTTKISGGTLALSGTGSIAMSSGVIDAGTFDVSATTSGTSIKGLTGAGGVTLGSRTLAVTNAAGTYSGGLGAVGDAGGFYVAGGTQTLSSVTGLYTGATTINAGAALMLTNATSLGSSGVTANGMLDVSGNGNTTLAALNGSGAATLGATTLNVSSGAFTGILGAVGDAGGLTKTGADTFTFAGGNYTGATIVATGTLIQTGQTANAPSVGIALGATLQTTAANVFNSAAVLNDAGTLVLNDRSQTIGSLTGNGTVQLGTGTLTFTAATNTFSGSLMGTGGLVKTGTSTFTVSGASTYAGDTNVNGGVLNVTGSISGSNVIVNSGGTLSGSGTIVDPTINAGGTLAPGFVNGTPTTLSMGGPLVFMPGSFYNVIVNPTASDRTVVTGTTTINGGTVNVLAGSGIYQAQSRYDILTSSGGVTGQFAAVTSNLAFLASTLVYDANDVSLVLSRNDLAFATVAATANQRAVANGLTNASRLAQGPTGGALLNAVLALSAPQAQAAFDSLSGEGIAATQNLAHRSADLFTAAIFDQTTFYGGGSGNQIVLTAPQPGAGLSALALSEGIATTFKSGKLQASPDRELADLPPAAFIAPTPVAPQRSWRAWGSGFGGDEEIHGNEVLGAAAQSNQVYGGAVGVDYQITPNDLIGVAVGGSDAAVSEPNRATSGSTIGGHVAVYDVTTFGAFYGASSTSASFYQNRTTRTVAGFGGLANETERGDFSSHELRGRLEVGRSFAGTTSRGGVGTITPFVALEIADLRTNGFGEQTIAGPGVFRLNVSGQSTADVPSFVGLRFSRPTELGNGVVLKPTLQLAYVHEFAPYRTQFAGLASLPGAVFLVDGARPARNAAQVKAGGELGIGPRTAIFANFDGEFSGIHQLYAGKGGVRYLF